MFLRFIIFIRILVFFTIFLNPHASTLGRGIFVAAGIRHFPRDFVLLIYVYLEYLFVYSEIRLNFILVPLYIYRALHHLFKGPPVPQFV